MQALLLIRTVKTVSSRYPGGSIVAGLWRGFAAWLKAAIQAVRRHAGGGGLRQASAASFCDAASLSCPHPRPSAGSARAVVCGFDRFLPAHGGLRVPIAKPLHPAEPIPGLCAIFRLRSGGLRLGLRFAEHHFAPVIGECCGGLHRIERPEAQCSFVAVKSHCVLGEADKVADRGIGRPTRDEAPHATKPAARPGCRKARMSEFGADRIERGQVRKIEARRLVLARASGGSGGGLRAPADRAASGFALSDACRPAAGVSSAPSTLAARPARQEFLLLAHSSCPSRRGPRRASASGSARVRSRL